MSEPDRLALIDHLAALERRLSVEHMEAIERWIRSEPLTGRSPSSLVHYWRFFAQLCGQVLQLGRRDDLDLATRTVLRGGAWVANMDRDRTWLYYSFVRYCAVELGLDPDRYLADYAEDLEPSLARSITDAIPALGNVVGVVDERNDRHVPVVIGGSVDFEGAWDPAAHERLVESAVNRFSMAEKTAAHYERVYGKARAEAFRASVDTPSLQWLPEGARIYDDTDLVGDEVRARLTAVAGDLLEAAPGVADDLLAEFIREQASRASRYGDEPALAVALRLAAAFAPTLLGLPFRAAEHMLGSAAEPWLTALADGLPDQPRHAILAWADRADRVTDLDGYVETGLRGGLKFSRRRTGRQDRAT